MNRMSTMSAKDAARRAGTPATNGADRHSDAAPARHEAGVGCRSTRPVRPASTARNILVTGASSGIGRAIVEYLAARGDRVFAGARSDRAIGELGRLPNVVPVRLDVTQAESVDAAVAHVCGLTDTLDALVNNAGSVVAGPLIDVTPEAMSAQLEVNLVGVHRVTRAFFPLLLAAKGHVVNISSTGGRVALPFMGPYVASKFGLEAFSDSLRRELAPCGVQVSVIQPGAIRTPIWDKTDPHDARLDGSIFAARARAFGRLMLERARTGGRPPDTIARAVHRVLGSRRPRPRYLVTEANLMTRVAGLLPDRWLDFAISRAIQGGSQ